jgi:hypothetical protein
MNARAEFLASPPPGVMPASLITVHTNSPMPHSCYGLHGPAFSNTQTRGAEYNRLDLK